MKLSDAEELKNLMDQAAYEAYLKEHEEWCLEFVEYSHFQMIFSVPNLNGHFDGAV